MKIIGFIGCGVLLVICVALTLQSLKNESEQLAYAINSMDFLPTWETKQDYSHACQKEGSQGRDEDDGSILKVDQVVSLVKQGFNVCLIDGRVGVPIGVARALFEAAYVPTKATIPYELAKRALEGKPKRCSDYIEPLIYNCPKMLQPYMNRVSKNIQSKS